MSILDGLQNYYDLLGARGVLLATKARLLNRSIETDFVSPNLKYPVHLRVRTSDVSVFRQVLVTREYDCDFAIRPLTIIDAGANIGLTSVFYANKYPNATIIAIEPEASNFHMLEKNTAPYPNIHSIKAALWKDNTQVKLVDPNLGHYGFQTMEASDGNASEEMPSVPGVTLDKILTEFNLGSVDILKVDIEGSEKEIFENCCSWIDKVKVIVVELHDHLKSGCSDSVYRAVKAFDLEWRKGETIFFAKKEVAVQS